MAIEKVKDNLNKDRRREAFNQIHNRSKGDGKQKLNQFWLKELKDIDPIDEIDEYNDEDENVEEYIDD